MRQVKKHNPFRTGFIGTAILTVLWVLLSLSVLPCTGVEAAVPKPEEISGDYRLYIKKTGNDSGSGLLKAGDDGTARLILQGKTLQLNSVWPGHVQLNVQLAYNAQKGTANQKGAANISSTDKHGQVQVQFFSIRFSKGADGNVQASGFFTVSFKGKSNTQTSYYSATKVSSVGNASGGGKKTDKESGKKKQEAEKQKKVAERNAVPGVARDSMQNGRDIDDDERNQDGLPESDAGKAAAAVGTAVVGALLGGAAGAASGAAGSAGGGYGPSEGSYGQDEDDYGPDDDGYGSYEGSYGPDEGDKETLPDNLAVADDGSIRITSPTGEEMVYTRNEDGTYNIPTQTETGENLTWQDEDGNFHTVEPGTVTKEDILEGAKWYKDHERELLADRAAEDARQQAERDRLAAENAKWLEKERLVNSQLSQTSIETQKELRKLEAQQAQDDFVEKMRWKYGNGDESLSKDDLKRIMKQEQLKSNMEGGYHDQEAAEWDDRIVTAQEVKFGADIAVMTYSTLAHNQAFANVYSAATNYGETMMDAAVNHKDMGKAVLKATIDTGLDLAANKLEDHGWHVIGNAGAQVYKQVNDNLYNGRDAWEGTGTAAYYGSLTGLAGKGVNKLGEMSQGTVLGREIGGAGIKPKLNTDIEVGSSGSKPRTNLGVETGGSKPKTNLGTETKGVRKTTIAERRLGKGQYKTEMSEADVKMQINEDVQANRAMNEVRKLNKISKKMGAMEKANPKTYKNDSEYQKLSQEFDAQSRTVRENKLSVDRMNAIKGETGTELRQRYNRSDLEYEKEVLKIRNESLAAEKGLDTSQIGDYNVTSNKVEEKLAGGSAGHDTDTSPYVKVNTETGKNSKVDFSQVDGDHHLARAVYKAEYGRYPQTAAEYDKALKLKEVRDFTNVSTAPGTTHEISHNPDAYVGSGKGEVGRVLHPEQYGTPEKGTGVFNEQTAIHKQGTPLERHQQQYAEAQKLREQLKTDTNLSAAEKTEIGKKISTLERQSASNHYESTRTTAKEYNVIKGINDVNIKNGLGDGMSDDARYIGNLAEQVKEGKIDNATYKQIVTEKYGSEEAAQRIVAKGFRDTNK